MVKIFVISPDKKKEMVKACGVVSTVVLNMFADIMIWV
jgi:hypothetical protein